MVAVCRWKIDCWEWEGICHFESGLSIHTDEETGRGGWECLGTVFDDFHHHLLPVRTILLLIYIVLSLEYQCLDLDGR